MGKLIKFLTILIFVDLLFIMTGQICAVGECSLGSTIFGSIINLVDNVNGGDITTTQIFRELIGDVSGGIVELFKSPTGIAALFGTGAVIIGAFFATKQFNILFIPITVTLALLTSDLVFIAKTLFVLNLWLGVLIMIPLIIIYMIVVVSWLKGQD